MIREIDQSELISEGMVQSPVLGPIMIREISSESGRIYIVDEDFSKLKTKEFASLVLKSDNCFIIITRESLPAIPYSYKEIYGIKTSGKYHSLERIYPDYDELTEKNVMVTEDEDAGLEYYQHYFGDKVMTKSELYLPESFEWKKCLIG